MPNGTEQEGVENAQVSEDTTAQEHSDAGQSDAEARIAELQAELDRVSKNLGASRRFERNAKETRTALETEVSELRAFKERAEKAESLLNEQAIERALTEAATAAKAKNVKMVVSKLVDRTAIKVENGVANAEDVEAQMLKTKEEFADQFDVTPVPDVARAAEGSPVGGYAKELDACKTTADIEAVMRKYGKR